jgi:hypothetical protein
MANTEKQTVKTQATDSPVIIQKDKTAIAR